MCELLSHPRQKLMDEVRSVRTNTIHIKKHIKRDKPVKKGCPYLI